MSRKLLQLGELEQGRRYPAVSERVGVPQGEPNCGAVGYRGGFGRLHRDVGTQSDLFLLRGRE
eukprot:11025190-Alexandrium_andersonii.AAC.1